MKNKYNNNSIFIDSTNIVSELCSLGKKFNTDKSPFSENSVCLQHRKGYTAVYNLLFAPYKNKEIVFGEIGIADSASMLMWNNFFNCADIHGFEYFQKLIDKCDSLNLNVHCHYIDINSKESINDSFSKINKKFDIIIDDGTHQKNHQNNIIDCCGKYLKSGGMLIIEDIFREDSIELYNINNEIWSFFTFITCHHENSFTTPNVINGELKTLQERDYLYKKGLLKNLENDKILILVKK